MIRVTPSAVPLRGWTFNVPERGAPSAYASRLVKGLGASVGTVQMQRSCIPPGSAAIEGSLAPTPRFSDSGVAAVQPHVQDDPLTAWIRSGAAYLTGFPEGPALAPPLDVGTAMDGAAVAFQLLAEAVGQPTPVDGAGLLGERAAIHGFTTRGSTSCGGATRLLATADGHVALNLARPTDIDLLGALLRRHPGEDPWGTAQRILLSLTTADVVRRSAELGLPCAGQPDAPIGTAASPWILESLGGKPTSPEAANGPRRPPMVLDLSSLWAGPLAGGLLASAGGKVVKIEHPERPDGTRRGPPRFFQLLNGRKQHLAIDLHDPASWARFEELLDAADIVIDNLRPSRSGGLDTALRSLIAGTPSLTWISITGYGLTGPDRSRPAFGDDAAVAAGLVLRDPTTGQPCFCADAIADPITGLHAAIAALAGYLGGGRWLIDAPLTRAVSHIVHESASDNGARMASPLEGLIVPLDRDELPRPWSRPMDEPGEMARSQPGEPDRHR